MRKLFDSILTAAGYATAGLVVLVTLLLIYEVIMRYFLHTPSGWAFDFTMYDICYLTFLGAPWLLREEGHVRIEIITSRLSNKGQGLLTSLTSFAALLACGIFFWEATKLTWDAYREHQFINGSIIVPRHMIIGIMPIGMFLLCVQFARMTWKNFRDFRRGNDHKKLM